MMESEVEEEIFALREIFQSDFATLPDGPWGAKAFRLEVRPNSSTTHYSYGHITLQFLIPKAYPKVSPSVTLFQTDISKKNKLFIEKEIKQFLKSHTGSILCYDLVQLVQDLLLKAGPVHQTKSLYEFMEDRERKETQTLLEIIQEKPPNVPIPVADMKPPSTAEENVAVEAHEMVSDGWLAAFVRHRSAEEEEDPRPSKALPLGASPRGRSRYYEEFAEIALLGRGAGGAVWSCQNLLDNRTYAIKKIHLESSDSTSINREVRLLSSIMHKNIVRYYSAWIEEADVGVAIVASSSTPTGLYRLPNNEGIPKGEEEEEEENNMAERIEDLGDDYDFWTEPSLRLQLDPFPGFEFVDSSKQTNDSDSMLSAADNDTAEATQSSAIERDGQGRSKKVLYIQMEFCPATLRSLIDKGSLHERTSEIFHLLRQILQGLVYIHKEGVLHRDLKPLNIFLDAEGTIKIGDFGLATSLHETTASLSASSPLQASKNEGSSLEGLTQGVGTALYRAPEYESSSGIMASLKRTDGDKADMYSLGIVLFEMMSPPFATGMERVMEISRLREVIAILSHALDLYNFD